MQISVYGNKEYSFKSMFYVCSYAIILLGTVINVLQIILYIPLTEHISKIFSGDFDIGIRDIFLLSSEEGSMPGIIKVFGSVPLYIYLMSFGVSNFIKTDALNMHKLRQLNRVALCAVLIRIFFSLEHKNIMAVLLANIFLVFEKGYIRKIRYWIFIALFIFLADYLFRKTTGKFWISRFYFDIS